MGNNVQYNSSIQLSDKLILTLIWVNKLHYSIDIILQTLFHSQFTEDEIEAARESIACEIEMFKMGADQEPIVTDLVHTAAFNNNTGKW